MLTVPRLLPGKLRLSGDQIFYTIQGEGVSAGQPAVFIRLHECNLECEWCDAWYTWKEDTIEYQTEGKDLDVRQAASLLIARMETLYDAANVLVITGGEPLMQKRALDSLIDLVMKGLQRPIRFEIETNGTIVPTESMFDLAKLGWLQFNVSPKTRNSGNNPTRMFKPDVLREFTKSPHAWFKFVISSGADILDIKKYIAEAELPKNRIILMPEGTTKDELKIHMQHCVNIAMAEGYRVTPRLQIDMFGNRRAT